MNKTRVIFIILSLYILAAFSWWTIAHIRSSKTIKQQQMERLEILCYKATLDINSGVSDYLFADSSALKQYVNTNFPELEILFEPSKPPLENFLLRPKKQSYLDINNLFRRKVWMYLTEGIVMVVLLFWGIIWVYRSFEQSIRLKRQQSNFLLSITHELKTPIASVKLYLETLQKREVDATQKATILNNSLTDIRRLKELVENILLSAQLDTKNFQLNPKPLNLSALVERVLDSFVLPRNLFDRVTKYIEKDLWYKTDEFAMETILNNLLSNAVKYTRSEEKISVVLKKEGDRIVLQVCDEGEGIPEQEKNKIFEVFYRAGDENTRKSKGTGLGLYIVKNLLNLQNLQLQIKDNQPKGSIFEIEFNLLD